MDTLINNLATSAEAAARNLVPRITQILNSMSQVVTQLAPVISSAIPTIVTEVIPNMISAGVQLLQSLLLGISQNIDAVAAGAIEVCMMLTEALISNLPLLVQVGMQLITALITGIAQRMPELYPVITAGMVQAIAALIACLPEFLSAGIQLIGGVGDGMIASFKMLCPQVGGWVEENIYNPIKERYGTALQIGGEIISKLWSGICDFANMLFPGLGDLIGGHTENAVNASTEILVSSGEKIPTNAKTMVSAMAENINNDTSMEVAVQEAVDRSATQMTDSVASAGFDSAGVDAMQKFINGINSMYSAVMAAVDRIANAAVQRMQNAMNQVNNMANGASIDGTWAIGLNYVPFDGYIAELHKGEAVLTAAEAAVWRAGKQSGEAEAQATTNQQTSTQSGITIVQNIQTVPQTPVEFAAATEAYFEQARWAMA
jgi:hypothetical protein